MTRSKSPNAFDHLLRVFIAERNFADYLKKRETSMKKQCPKIMVVEDDNDIREAMVLFLEMMLRLGGRPFLRHELGRRLLGRGFKPKPIRPG
jgi:hypothetical protein